MHAVGYFYGLGQVSAFVCGNNKDTQTHIHIHVHAHMHTYVHKHQSHTHTERERERGGEREREREGGREREQIGQKNEVQSPICTVKDAGALNTITHVNRYFQYPLTKYIDSRDRRSLWGG